MTLWKIIYIIVLYILSEITSNPIPDNRNNKKMSDRKWFDLFTSRTRPVQLYGDYYLCKNYGKPYDLYDYLYSIPGTDDIFESQITPNRCRYLEEPPQKYTVWDLTRK